MGAFRCYIEYADSICAEKSPWEKLYGGWIIFNSSTAPKMGCAIAKARGDTPLADRAFSCSKERRVVGVHWLC